MSLVWQRMDNRMCMYSVEKQFLVSMISIGEIHVLNL